MSRVLSVANTHLAALDDNALAAELKRGKQEALRRHHEQTRQIAQGSSGGASDPNAPSGDESAAIAQCGIARTKDLKTWERLPDLKTPARRSRTGC